MRNTPWKELYQTEMSLCRTKCYASSSYISRKRVESWSQAKNNLWQGKNRHHKLYSYICLLYFFLVFQMFMFYPQFFVSSALWLLVVGLMCYGLASSATNVAIALMFRTARYLLKPSRCVSLSLCINAETTTVVQEVQLFGDGSSTDLGTILKVFFLQK